MYVYTRHHHHHCHHPVPSWPWAEKMGLPRRNTSPGTPKIVSILWEKSSGNTSRASAVRNGCSTEAASQRTVSEEIASGIGPVAAFSRRRRMPWMTISKLSSPHPLLQ